MKEKRRKRSNHIAFKIMPNGNIRAYQDDKYKKDAVSELQIVNPENEAQTLMTGITPKIYTTINPQKMKDLPKELEGKKFRVRKLTNRECYRIMDVDEEDIDKLLATSISKTGHYKLAGNSICENVLYHIFRKMFIEPENENQQLTLF